MAKARRPRDHRLNDGDQFMPEIKLPEGVADSWFHLSAGGEVYVSRVCRGADLIKVLEDIVPGAHEYEEDLADPDFWYVCNGRPVSCSLACGEDPELEVRLIDDPKVIDVLNAILPA